jgi:glycosyltransferase involved in cell wall biosynthesis
MTTNKALNILFITNLYPPVDIGGYEQLCQEVAHELMSRGHYLSVLTSNYKKNISESIHTESIERSLFLESDLDYYNPFNFFFLRPFRNILNFIALRGEIKKRKPDVILVWGMWNMSYYIPIWAEKLSPGRVFYYISSYWPIDEDPHRIYWKLPTKHTPRKNLKQILGKLVLLLLDLEKYPPKMNLKRAVCCSKFVRGKIYESGNISETAGVIYPSIDVDAFINNERILKPKSKNKKIDLLYFGRLIEDKGVHTAIEAAGLLKQHGFQDDFHLTLLGSGHPEYEHNLIELVNRLDLKNNVTFQRKIPRSEIPNYLKKFDVYLFTSIWPEPFPRTIEEAMASGLIVIGSNVGGSPEILLDYDERLIFEKDDSESLFRKIRFLLENPNLQDELVYKGQRLICEKYDFKNMVSEIETFLQQVNVA